MSSKTSMEQDNPPYRSPEECAKLLRRSRDLGQVFQTGVKISQTAYGLGVFSYAFIPTGTPIGRVRGIVVYDENYSSDYCITAGEQLVLEPAPPFCYMNHSCEPNCSLVHYLKENEQENESPQEPLESSQSVTYDDLYGEDGPWSDELTEDDECFFGDGGAEELDENFCDDLENAENLENSEFETDEIDNHHLFNDEQYGVEIWVEATKDILPGEQLTIDYAWTSDRAVRCLCGVPSCRGWIIDPEYLPEREES